MKSVITCSFIRKFHLSSIWKIRKLAPSITSICSVFSIFSTFICSRSSSKRWLASTTLSYACTFQVTISVSHILKMSGMYFIIILYTHSFYLLKCFHVVHIFAFFLLFGLHIHEILLYIVHDIIASCNVADSQNIARTNYMCNVMSYYIVSSISHYFLTFSHRTCALWADASNRLNSIRPIRLPVDDKTVYPSRPLSLRHMWVR